VHAGLISGVTSTKPARRPFAGPGRGRFQYAASVIAADADAQLGAALFIVATAFISGGRAQTAMPRIPRCVRSVSSARRPRADLRAACFCICAVLDNKLDYP
jgi:hypothetical protein